MSPPAGPASPGAWLVAGLVLDFIGAAIYFSGRESRPEDSIQPLIGSIILAVGGVLVLIGAAGVGALVALRRHAWETSQQDQAS